MQCHVCTAPPGCQVCVRPHSRCRLRRQLANRAAGDASPAHRAGKGQGAALAGHARDGCAGTQVQVGARSLFSDNKLHLQGSTIHCNQWENRHTLPLPRASRTDSWTQRPAAELALIALHVVACNTHRLGGMTAAPMTAAPAPRPRRRTGDPAVQDADEPESRAPPLLAVLQPGADPAPVSTAAPPARTAAAAPARKRQQVDGTQCRCSAKDPSCHMQCCTRVAIPSTARVAEQMSAMAVQVHNISILVNGMQVAAEEAAAAKRVARGPTLLVLDGRLQPLPWESSPSLSHLR